MWRHAKEQVKRPPHVAEDDRAVPDGRGLMVAHEADACALQVGLKRAAADLAQDR